MSNSINPAKRATANLKRKHPRISIFAASAAAAGVLGAAGFAVGSAPWSQAAGDAAKTVQSGSQQAQLDDLRSAGAGGTSIDATAASVSDSATHHAVQAAVDRTAKGALARHAVKAPAKPADKHAPAKDAPKKDAPKKDAHKKHVHKKKHAPAKPYQMWDSVTPSALPAGQAAAVYANGAYKASDSQVKGHRSLLWIDTNGSTPGATVLDVEPGDATPAGAAHWAKQRLTRHPHSVAIIYTMLSQWQQVKNQVAHLPKSIQLNVKYWIADPTGVDHIVPGSNATQWYWGPHTDISTANPSLTEAR